MMSTESVASRTLYRQLHAGGGDQRALADRALPGRIWRFAGRHHRRLGTFVVISVVSALLTVATPMLAGKVVDAIVHGAAPATVVLLSTVIAAVALAEAAVSLVTRWLSSTIGEGLILDLRTAVFDHVQKMPVAFFTRTRTGALVSRLGDDVMGAQGAFSDTLSGVVSSVITLTLTLAAMIAISWQVTAISLMLVSLFVLPARRIGALMARLSRESAIRSAFMNSLTLMSALALVYGLGGVLAIGGHLPAGAIVSLALLLTRLYPPLTALANAHVEIASALVSFERVFEVLDLVPLIRERPGAVPVPGSIEFDDVRFSYPSADQVSLASLEDVATLDRGGDEVLHGISFTARPGQMVALAHRLSTKFGTEEAAA
jgi:ABC-type multidrug transport system fused ATPase/permease subunit